MIAVLGRGPGPVRRHVGGALAALGAATLSVDDVRPLRAVGGGLLASPGWIPLVLALAVLLPGSGLLARRAIWIGALALGLFGVVLSTTTALLDSSVAYGVDPVSKGSRVLGAFLLWIVVLLAGWVLTRQVPRHLAIGLLVSLALMCVGALLYRFGVHALDDWTFLHSEANAQQRVRSTRIEASALGAGLLVQTALLVVLIRGRRLRLLGGAVGLVATVLLADSRGTSVVAAVGIVLLVLLQVLVRFIPAVHARGLALATGIAVAAAAVAVAIGLGVVVESPMWHAFGLSDASRGTSDATRAGWALTSFEVLTQSPAGLGFSTYLQSTPHLLEQAVGALSSVFNGNALSELVGSARGVSDSGVSPKTAPTLAAFFLGVPGVVALIVLWAADVRRAALEAFAARTPVVVVTIGCAVAAAALYFSALTSWEQALLWGAALTLGGARTVAASSRISRNSRARSRRRAAHRATPDSTSAVAESQQRAPEPVH